MIVQLHDLAFCTQREVRRGSAIEPTRRGAIDLERNKGAGPSIEKLGKRATEARRPVAVDCLDAVASCFGGYLEISPARMVMYARDLGSKHEGMGYGSDYCASFRKHSTK